MLVDGAELGDRHRQHLGICTGFIGHLQYTNWATADYGTTNDGVRGDHQYIHWVAIVREGMRYIAIVTGVVHRCVHKAVHEHGSGLFIDLILYGVCVGRDLNDYIDLFGDIFTS
jgi:hypothetical protein